MNNKLRIALPKGRMVKNAADVFSAFNYSSSELDEELAWRAEKGKSTDKLDKNFYSDSAVDFIIPKARDLAGYVDEGIADLGILGEDSKNEYESDNPGCGRGFISSGINARFPFPKMQFCIVGPEGGKQEYLERIAEQKNIIVASSYPGQAKDYFARQYPDYNTRFLDMMPLEGEVELAVRTGRADVGFEIVSSGASLEKNQLSIYQEAYEILVKLLSNRAALRNNPEVARLAKMIETGKSQIRTSRICTEYPSIH